MPWKLLGFIVFLGALLLFIGLNLGNSCDISFWFGFTVEAVPIYLTVFSTFVLGLLCAIPLSVSFKSKKNKSPDAPARNAGGGEGPQFGKKRSRKKKDESPAEGSPDALGGGPYGIN